MYLHLLFYSVTTPFVPVKDFRPVNFCKLHGNPFSCNHMPLSAVILFNRFSPLSIDLAPRLTSSVLFGFQRSLFPLLLLISECLEKTLGQIIKFFKLFSFRTAVSGTRTHTLKVQEPKSCASANSAITACMLPPKRYKASFPGRLYTFFALILLFLTHPSDNGDF